LPDKTKKYIAQYNQAMKNVQEIENSKMLAIRNSRTGELTEQGKSKLLHAKECAEDYNEYIVDGIILFIEEKEETAKILAEESEEAEKEKPSDVEVKTNEGSDTPIIITTDSKRSGKFFTIGRKKR